MKNYKIHEGDEIFRTNAKNVDGAVLPPCKAELQKQLKRTAYIAHLWRHAYLPQPTEFLPTDYGWQESEDKLVFERFEGDQLPKSIDDVAINSEENQDKETNTEQDQGQSDEEDDPEINNSDIEDSNIILDETDDSIDQCDMDEWL
ncbi:uncharacterized protein LOC124185024 [Neodiprion fabricii]|uniref:uncharacterized protein LOC124185024 n=1 Tax=Neodiprion fabricii TaxID=2872261 RepID=UPI001ED95897|nr:uncharacterized protein LOC124185024 [Neodiprion fabricii]